MDSSAEGVAARARSPVLRAPRTPKFGDQMGVEGGGQRVDAQIIGVLAEPALILSGFRSDWIRSPL